MRLSIAEKVAEVLTNECARCGAPLPQQPRRIRPTMPVTVYIWVFLVYAALSLAAVGWEFTNFGTAWLSLLLGPIGVMLFLWVSDRVIFIVQHG